MDLAKKGLGLVVITAVVSGFSIFINSFGVKGFDSSVFTFSKNIVVALLLFSIIFLVGQWNQLKRLTRRQWRLLITIGFIGGSIPFLLFFKGLQLTTGTTSAFIHKTLFIYASIFALMFLGEKLTKGLIIGVALVLSGNYLMLLPSFDFSIGHLFILGATILWAAENTLSKYTLKDVPGTIVAWGRMCFGSLFILLFLLFTGKAPLIVSMSLEQYLWIGVTSILLLLYVFTYYNGLAHIKVSTATALLALGSPITTILNILFNDGSVTLAQSMGMLLIVGGIVSIIWFAQLLSTTKHWLGARS